VPAHDHVAPTKPTPKIYTEEVSPHYLTIHIGYTARGGVESRVVRGCS